MPLIWLSGHGPSLSGLVSRVLFIYRKGSFLVGGIETVHEPTGFKQHSFMIYYLSGGRDSDLGLIRLKIKVLVRLLILMSLREILDFPGASKERIHLPMRET